MKSKRCSEVFFSTVSIWETAIKHSRRRVEFQVELGERRRNMLANHFAEIAVLGEHAVAVASLPLRHKYPFDRILIAQAVVEGIALLTSDAKIAQYAGPILHV